MLTFNLKKEWFEKIKSGEKTHEYRIDNDYWATRILNYIDYCNEHGKPMTICFKCGYPKSDEKDKILYANVIDEPYTCNGLDTDLKINKPVWDIEFELLTEEVQA